ncbi:hypothetical protein ACFDCM_10395 [Enterococcus lactis]|uniref:hypothetical protein n=1 Tax=Enterococcus lactis TaxID=357441 RepID=UPI0039A70989
MIPHIYFWGPQIESFKENNRRVKVLYEDTMIDKDELWNKYTKEVEKDLKQVQFGPDDDPSDLYDIYTDRMTDISDLFHHAIAIHKYQYLTLLCQTWENEFVSFVNKEMSNYYLLNKPLSYSKVMNDILLKNMEEKKVKELSKIRELRLLVNVIKHGEGNSAIKLRKRRPDFFKYRTTEPLDKINDRLVTWNSVLLDSDALNVDEKEFYSYYSAINEFWDSMPTRVFLDGKTPPSYEEKNYRINF